LTYYANLKFFKSRLVTKSSKLNLNRTVIRFNSGLCIRNTGVERKYNSETAGLLEENLKRNIWAYKKNQIWRIKNNEELDKLIKHENIVNYIKAQRLNWFGHVQRMPETRAAKKIFKWNPLTTRPRRRPKHRWEDNIMQDLGQMKIKNWITSVQDRAKWKVVDEKAKTSN